MKLHLINNSGQTLIEALIALSIIVVIMSATTVAVITSLNNASFVKSQNQVNKIAQQGMEYIRDQIVNNNRFTTYASYSPTTRCMPSTYDMSTYVVYIADRPDQYCTSFIDNKFLRTVTFTAADCDTSSAVTDFTDGLKVTVRVLWNDSKCPTGTAGKYCHEQEITSCFIDPSKTAAPAQQGI